MPNCSLTILHFLSQTDQQLSYAMQLELYSLVLFVWGQEPLWRQFFYNCEYFCTHFS